MAFVETPPEHSHHRIVFHALERLNRTAVAHDRQSKARSCSLAIHNNRTSTARSVFAP
jgi:hypothetical protein